MDCTSPARAACLSFEKQTLSSSKPYARPQSSEDTPKHIGRGQNGVAGTSKGRSGTNQFVRCLAWTALSMLS